MKIPCPACAAKYSVADDKIQSRLAKIRCRKCGVTIVIDGTVDPVNVYVGEGGQKTSAALSLAGVAAPPERPEAPPESGSPDSTGPGPNEYAVDIADNDQRNMSLERIVAAYNSGVVTGETYIWKEGMADWQMLAEVPEVYNALHAAARVSGVPGGGSFGRSQPDPFAHGAAGDQDQSLLAGTGARNESSVLFSLSALTSGTVAGPTGSSSGSERKNAKRAEDSGLIDLQALTAAAESPAPFSSPSPAAPFGGPALISAPLGGVTSSTMHGAFGDYSTKRSSSKTGFIIGGVALLAAAVASVVFLMQSGETSSPAGVAVSEERSPAARAEEPQRKPAAEEDEPAAATAAAEPEQEPAAAAEKKPAAAVEPEDEGAAPVRKVTHSPQAPRKNTPASLPPSPRPAAPKPPPEPAAEAPKPAAPAAPAAPSTADRKKKACDCKPADLMCAMRCSAAK